MQLNYIAIGANVYAPGVLAVPKGNLTSIIFVTLFLLLPELKVGDIVSVWADLDGSCLRGLNQSLSFIEFNIMVLGSTETKGQKLFVGNGRS